MPGSGRAFFLFQRIHIAELSLNAAVTIASPATR
jgi:hypothetical protein